MSGLNCPTQEEVRAFTCPACDAGAGEPCVEDGKPRARNHAERLKRAKAAASERAQARKRKATR